MTKFHRTQQVRHFHNKKWVNAEVIIATDTFIRIRTEEDEDIELLAASLTRDVIRSRGMDVLSKPRKTTRFTR
jgi:hypothetical protein